MCPKEIRGMEGIGSRETRDGTPASGGRKGENGKRIGENGKRKGEMNPSVAMRQLPYKQGSKKVHSTLKKV